MERSPMGIIALKKEQWEHLKRVMVGEFGLGGSFEDWKKGYERLIKKNEPRTSELRLIEVDVPEFLEQCSARQVPPTTEEWLSYCQRKMVAAILKKYE